MDNKLLLILLIKINGEIGVVHNSDMHIDEELILSGMLVKNLETKTEDKSKGWLNMVLIECDTDKYRRVYRNGDISDTCSELQSILQTVNITLAECTMKSLSLGREQSSRLKDLMGISYHYLTVYFMDYAVFSVLHGWDCATTDTYHFVRGNKVNLSDDCAIIPGMRWMY